MARTPFSVSQEKSIRMAAMCCLSRSRSSHSLVDELRMRLWILLFYIGGEIVVAALNFMLR
jgi:hypothetical protein